VAEERLTRQQAECAGRAHAPDLHVGRVVRGGAVFRVRA
jgi:hypothetical protein